MFLLKLSTGVSGGTSKALQRNLLLAEVVDEANLHKIEKPDLVDIVDWFVLTLNNWTGTAMGMSA